MKDYIKERALELAEYILESGTTVMSIGNSQYAEQTLERLDACI